MKFWPVKINKEKIDPKSIHPELHNIPRRWLLMLLVFASVLVFGILLSVFNFVSIFAEYEPELNIENKEEILDINIEAIQRVVEKREEMRNREVKIPKDPSF